mmetsp:Transcript_7738/g.7971  ORF Transcript_7738/g.7971 Transcript_7738/m.7971 type:complete len:841 (+) Transcript_7738:2520-5042(+)
MWQKNTLVKSFDFTRKIQNVIAVNRKFILLDFDIVVLNEDESVTSDKAVIKYNKNLISNDEVITSMCPYKENQLFIGLEDAGYAVQLWDISKNEEIQQYDLDTSYSSVGNVIKMKVLYDTFLHTTAMIRRKMKKESNGTRKRVTEWEVDCKDVEPKDTNYIICLTDLLYIVVLDVDDSDIFSYIKTSNIGECHLKDFELNPFNKLQITAVGNKSTNYIINLEMMEEEIKREDTELGSYDVCAVKYLSKSVIVTVGESKEICIWKIDYTAKVEKIKNEEIEKNLEKKKLKEKEEKSKLDLIEIKTQNLKKKKSEDGERKDDDDSDSDMNVKFFMDDDNSQSNVTRTERMHTERNEEEQPKPEFLLIDHRLEKIISIKDAHQNTIKEITNISKVNEETESIMRIATLSNTEIKCWRIKFSDKEIRQTNSIKLNIDNIPSNLSFMYCSMMYLSTGKFNDNPTIAILSNTGLSYWDYRRNKKISHKNHINQFTFFCKFSDEFLISNNTSNHSIVKHDLNTDNNDDDNDHYGKINTVEVIDYQSILTGSDDHYIKEYETSTFSCTRTIKIHSAPVKQIGKLENNWICSADEDNLYIWHFKTQEVIKNIRKDEFKKFDIINKKTILYHFDYYFGFIDIDLLQSKKISFEWGDNIDNFTTNNEEQALVVKNRTIYYSNINQFRVEKEQKVLKKIIRPNMGERVIGGGARSMMMRAREQDESNNKVRIIDMMSSPLLALGKNLVVITNRRYELVVIDYLIGLEIAKFSGHTKYVLSMIRLSDSIFVSAGRDGTMRYWNLNTGKCELVKENLHEDDIFSLVKLKTNSILSVSDDSYIKLNKDKLKQGGS